MTSIATFVRMYRVDLVLLRPFPYQWEWCSKIYRSKSGHRTHLSSVLQTFCDHYWDFIAGIWDMNQSFTDLPSKGIKIFDATMIFGSIHKVLFIKCRHSVHLLRFLQVFCNRTLLVLRSPMLFLRYKIKEHLWLMD